MHVFPSPYELIRLMHAFSPDLVFLDMSDVEAAVLLAHEICLISPRTGFVGFARSLEGRQAPPAIKAGVTPEFLTGPFTAEKFLSSVEQAMHKARPCVHDNLVAFLPAKAGSGATTVAVNLAGRLANDLRRRVLVIDSDLRSGLISVLLKTNAEYSVSDALDNAARLDGALWARMTADVQGLHLLLASRSWKQQVYGWTHYHDLLSFVMPRYDRVIVDLPEVTDDATVEIVRYASSAFLVCTPEVPSLELARQRRAELLERKIPDERIGLIVNRWNRRGMPLEEVEKFLERRVTFVFQNDYPGVYESIQKGQFVDRNSPLGQSFSAFARMVAGVSPAPPPKPAMGFLKSLIPTRAPA